MSLPVLLARCMAVVALLDGCAKPAPPETTAASGSSDDIASALRAGESAWAKRDDPSSLEASLAAYEQVLALDPGNRYALSMLTRGWYFYGDAHTTDPVLRVERWAKAVDWGNRCLAVNPAITTQLQGGAKEKDAILAATIEDVPCIYWTATALGKWAKAQSLSKTLRHLPTVKAYVTRVEELQPEYFHYGPARYWGAYYAALPDFAGRDFERSARYFDAAIEGAPYYLPTRVLRAELLAVGTQDVGLFEADLQHVLSAADDPQQADVAPENRTERAKAEALLARKTELFEDVGGSSTGSGENQ